MTHIKLKHMNIAKKITAALFAPLLAILSGCSGITNLTPERVPENSSRIYTLTMSAHINDGSLVKDSIEPFVVIDEQTVPMKATSEMENDRIYEYDYTLPKGRKDAKYYFILKYKSKNASQGDEPVERTMTSPTVYTLEPVSRYVVSLQNDRGAVGTEITVLGRGFDKLDKVFIGGVEADTKYVSRSTIVFTVPPMQYGKNYDVELRGEDSASWIGQFRVDPSEIEVSPSAVSILSGDVVNVIFNIGFKAPEGGFKIDVKTNIPSSVVMDEVVVPEGRTSVSVSLKGAAEGRGAIYVNAPGFAEKVVPVEVSLPKEDSSVLSSVSEAAAKVESK